MQVNLNGLELVGELSQWFTPDWLAERIGRAVRQHFTGTPRILEPTAGDGALVAGLIAAGFPVECITAVETDPRLCRVLRERFPGLEVVCMQAQLLDPALRFDVVVGNTPYENGQDVEFANLALRYAPVAYLVVRSELLQMVSFHEDVLSHAEVTWEARCVGRPSFRGAQSKSGKKTGSGLFEVTVARLRGLALPKVENVETCSIPVEYWRKPTKT